jgi:hypothetical protein
MAMRIPPPQAKYSRASGPRAATLALSGYDSEWQIADGSRESAERSGMVLTCTISLARN